MSKLFLVFLLLGLSWGAVGQAQPTNTALKQYDQKAIYLKAGFWHTYYVQGARQYTTGIGYRNLRRALDVSPLAQNEFKGFRRQRRTALALSVIGILGWLSAIPISETNNEAAIASFAGGSAALLIAIPINFQASNRLTKSVWLYNRDVVSGKSLLPTE